MNEIAAINASENTDAPQAETQVDTVPHNIEAEQQLLGAILTNNDVFDRIAAIIKPQHFYEPVHARIFEIAASRIQKNTLAS
ncbi:MAG: DnaB-like helicase N-terminal domain-containing protein, partial [Pseudomonadota bacterium]|nr:DnaB-like helicase N-terminal domain-containing protein [Pseudomonadota bacterium]